ncbi:unnamed protein product [Diamesa tonsa]
MKRKLSADIQLNATIAGTTINSDMEHKKKRGSTVVDEKCRRTKRQQKRNRKMSDSSLSDLSSLSPSSRDDDYGTDLEVMAINQSNGDFPCRCANSSIISDYDDDGFQENSSHQSTNGSRRNSGVCQHDCHYNKRHFVNISKLDKLLSTSQYDAIINKIKATTDTISNSDTKYLIDITVKTITLFKKNKELQMKLSELQSDTRNFIDSVIKNPENQLLKNQLELMRN